MKRNTAVEYPPISRFALEAMASNTGCTSDRELAITFRMSAVAACCSRASFNSLPGVETDERLDRMAVGGMRLVLARLRPLTLRAFVAPVLPPVLDGRTIFAPGGQQGHLIGLNLTFDPRPFDPLLNLSSPVA